MEWFEVSSSQLDLTNSTERGIFMLRKLENKPNVSTITDLEI
jgi:hypothetical protein